MAISTPSELIDGGGNTNLITSAETTHYTVPADRKVLISKAFVKNNDAATLITVTISIGAESDTNTIWTETLNPLEERDISPLLGLSLAPGKLINKKASTTNKVTMFVNGTAFAPV